MNDRPTFNPAGELFRFARAQVPWRAPAVVANPETDDPVRLLDRPRRGAPLYVLGTGEQIAAHLMELLGELQSFAFDWDPSAWRRQRQAVFRSAQRFFAEGAVREAPAMIYSHRWSSSTYFEAQKQSLDLDLPEMEHGYLPGGRSALLGFERNDPVPFSIDPSSFDWYYASGVRPEDGFVHRWKKVVVRRDGRIILVRHREELGKASPSAEFRSLIREGHFPLHSELSRFSPSGAILWSNFKVLGFERHFPIRDSRGEIVDAVRQILGFNLSADGRIAYMGTSSSNVSMEDGGQGPEDLPYWPLIR